jgi:hypothetical protein
LSAVNSRSISAFEAPSGRQAHVQCLTDDILHDEDVAWTTQCENGIR